MVNQRVSGFHCSIDTKMDCECLGLYIFHVSFRGYGHNTHLVAYAPTHTQRYIHSHAYCICTYKHTVEDCYNGLNETSLRFKRISGDEKQKAKQAQNQNTKTYQDHTLPCVHTYTHTRTQTPQPGATYLVCFLILSVVMWKNTCLWHSTEVGKTLIGSFFFFSIFSVHSLVNMW